ncbi:MAG: hypothetical protein IPH08_05885 [Rhodocyclaceae bacterium]|nr:hypothetical protein [Rhodocyclaceae bacterium]
MTGNAVKFTGQGDVVLSIRAVAHATENQYRATLEFSVRDSGIGIAADKLEHIFEGFSQAESSTTRRFGGTGLGLSISKRLVALMGGELQVESEPGKGSRFYFTASFDLGRAEPVALPPLTVEGRNLRALIVDDNPMARQVTQSIVTSLAGPASAWLMATPQWHAFSRPRLAARPSTSCWSIGTCPVSTAGK